MSKEYSQSLLDEVRQIADDYSSGMSKVTDNLDQYSNEYRTEKITERKKSNKDKALNQLDTKIAKVRLQVKEVQDSINKKKYPLINSNIDSEKLRGEQAMTNAMLVLQNHYFNSNSEGVLNAIRQAIQSNRFDFVTTLIEQIESLPAKDEIQNMIKEKVSEIASEYFKERGVTLLNEELDILNYANEVTQLSTESINRNNEFVYIPEYPVNDFQEQMLLENLKSDAGVNVSNSSAKEGE